MRGCRPKRSDRHSHESGNPGLRGDGGKNLDPRLRGDDGQKGVIVIPAKAGIQAYAGMPTKKE